MSELRVVRAAGGIVWRRGDDERVEVVLVHRPRYDDWSLPKGKLAKREHPLLGAVREVCEETGVHAVPQVRLPSTRYLTGEPGVEKAVDYWSMRFAAQEPFTPNDEVDGVQWFPVPEAAGALTYGHDRGVLGAFAELPPVTGLVVLIRHASAGERGEWPGPDTERPLDAEGRAQVAQLTTLLAAFRPARVVSASPARCVETVAPLAVALGLPVVVDGTFNEDADPAASAKALRAIAEQEATTVVCSQRQLIPAVLARLTSAGDPQRYATAKGTGWMLPFSRGGPHGGPLGGLVTADRLEL
jgi:8-oxo-dGTP pyrophosphatase MutT (NUDIX family)/phosphohistidine phosphatase SixA